MGLIPCLRLALSMAACAPQPVSPLLASESQTAAASDRLLEDVRIALAINLDMISRSDRDELYAAGAFPRPWLKPYLDRIAASASVTLKLGHDDPALGKDDWTGQSDHMAFHEIGLPWVYLGVEDHPDYHKPSDDFATIPQDFFRRSAATAELVVRELDRELESIARESAVAGK